jgi:thioredoxin 1
MLKNFTRAAPALLMLAGALTMPAFAADAMKKDMMKKQPMAAEPMAKDAMTKDAMAKDSMMMAPHFVAYTDAGFEAAQKAGKSMVVAIAADWCPVCTSQEMTLNKLMTEPGYAKTAFFRVDFDAQKAAVTKFKADKQSTLIAYRGTKELGRIEYTADKGRVTALAAKAKAS